ncbi:MAG TPA: formate dehydrogenase subunit alpha [Paracoccus solventivorans]|uniref:Formate dehydrogenase subunit alpha n=1 Tax=Paracoccus solventivorans TaxID=53463 RepID=A0A832PQ36_9RHOB|nr:formate dehydrogenase subunit alpha [Paracoccus solventivorans]HHW35428.1 formate dehydrogenase subunit alpha [Paracoccus solventivorans]
MKDFIIPDLRDLGTPAVRSDVTVTLSVDGIPVSVPAGTSVMRAAALAGVTVPKLCATDSLEAFGSCRLCVVAIEGMRGTPASCTTPVAEGMVVHTQTDEIAQIRRGVMELYLSDHPQDLLGSPITGNSEMQDMIGAVGLREMRYAPGKNHVQPWNDGAPNPEYRAPDDSNPYFTFDPALCIVCSRCVRACEEVQGTFALTIEGRGFDSRVSAGMASDDFLSSDCVSCGACVQVCPTGSLVENSVIQIGTPDRIVKTTCAYCGVGCSFDAHMRGETVVKMVPSKDGKANHGHSCVKGRFAWGYATHAERILHPMVREHYTDPWREVSWDEALDFAAERLRRAQAEHGRDSIGVITSSRCTNEETYLVQKLARAVFGNNNTDTCARVCHSPTGYGLKTTFGTSAGTHDFDSVEDTDLALVIGANPTDAHPVFGSRLRKRLRQGAGLIVIDPRRIDLLDTVHGGDGLHLSLMPGTNVAVLTSIAHVIVAEGLQDEAFIRERCDWDEFLAYREFLLDPRHSPEAVQAQSRVPAELIRQAACAYAAAPRASIYYGLGVTEHSQGSTTVMAIANLAMLTGNIGKPGTGVNPLRGQNNVQGSCDMGSFPHEYPGYRHVSDPETRAIYERVWGVELSEEPGLRINNMFDEATAGRFKGLYCQGEDVLQSDPNTSHVQQALASLDILIVHDIFLNETANYAHVFLPGSTFLEKNGTFTNAERRINMVRRAMAPRNGYEDWEITQMLANRLGGGWDYAHPSDIMDEIALTTPSFAGVSFDLLDREGSVQWPCNAAAPLGTPVMHIDGFVRGKGRFINTEYVATDERSGPGFPLLLTTGRTLTQYNVGAQTRRTDNTVWHPEDVLEIHPHDAENRGIRQGDLVRLASRAGETTLRAEVTERVAPGVVFTTFHHPGTQANVVTTDSSDWATNCPEFKVTAVQVSPSNGPSEWQESYTRHAELSRRILPAAE